VATGSRINGPEVGGSFEMVSVDVGADGQVGGGVDADIPA
jgi:hypothetical protein